MANDILSESLIQYTIVGANSITSTQFNESASLFSSHYGSWSAMTSPSLAGKRVKFTSKRFKEELLFDDNCFLVLAKISDTLIGHASVRVFSYHQTTASLPNNALWITQLVVASSFRNQRIATSLIHKALGIFPNVKIAGIISSNPYSIKAFLTVSGNRRKANKDFVQAHLGRMLKASGVPYLVPLDQCLIGSWFEKGSSVEEREKVKVNVMSSFFVDHTEIREVIKGLEDWDLGELEEGAEFGVVCEVKN